MKNLLAVIGDGSAGPVLEAALLVARRFNSHIVGLHSLTTEYAVVFGGEMGFSISSEVDRTLEREGHERRDQARRLFREFMNTHGIPIGAVAPGHNGPSASWREEDGRQNAGVGMSGRVYDLILVEQPEKLASIAEATLEDALFESGRPVLMVGAIVDSPNDYTEYLAGGGVNLFAASGNGASLLVLGSKATDSWYLEVYGLPTLTAGRLSATGFAGLYLPVESRGVRQSFLDPVTVLCRVHRWFALGGSYTVYKIAGLPARHGAGPAVQITIPSGSATIDALAGISSFTDELRLTLQFAF